MPTEGAGPEGDWYPEGEASRRRWRAPELPGPPPAPPSPRRAVNERVWFRLLVMPCCHIQLCWVNPRLPSYCPECGCQVPWPLGQVVHLTDQDASLRYRPAPA
jgi:hypothetical protein